ncbi:MAG: hypothetical protein E7608_03880 [Ruminococcaceae bacterium]|nr:hypothetical protein [Oscillospiraceae bacterium]
MLYSKKSDKSLDIELFKAPSKEYGAAPFWAWNCELKKETLEKQIEYMKEMGFGGYYMHTRVGMATPYLSDEFMELVSACIEKGKQIGMDSYLYDEDRWPSGSAGGFTAKADPENRQKFLCFTYTPYDDGTLITDADKAKSKAPNNEYTLLACFDVELDAQSKLVSYKRIALSEDAAAGHEKWFAYMEYAGYTDVMRKESIDTFINITHEQYKKWFGGEFGGSVPTIFTDEPQMKAKNPLAHAYDKKAPAILPYTNDLDETFKEKYGVSLLDNLPVLIWENASGVPSPLRYHYHNHTTERFAEAFCDNIGKWCEDNKIIFTGHMMHEESLYSQTMSIGEAMRHYRGFGLPGIDMLCDKRELNTAKQAQSTAHQYGKEGVMSELYGVTNWDFDFRGHKLQGDWQAALGVTHRVPHLYWVSMGGEAKRDYPAAIGHQSPWYKEYKHIEDHFARVNTVMTRGTPCVDVAVIHPIESYWLSFGPADQTGEHRSDLGNRHEQLTEWLLLGLQDFDFISESLLPEQYRETETGFAIGEMTYKTVIVPYLDTIRKTTLDALKKFRKAGGEVIFMGEAPSFVDAIPSDEAKDFAKECICISWSKSALINALEKYRFIKISKNDGYPLENVIYQLRNDGDKKHIFISHLYKEDYDCSPMIGTSIELTGEWKVQEYCTMTGEKRKLKVFYKNGKTIFPWVSKLCDSLLLELTPGKDTEEGGYVFFETRFSSAEYPVHKASYTLEEPNVLLLDRAEFSVNGGKWHAPLDVLKADKYIRSSLGEDVQIRRGVQPWQMPLNKDPKDVVDLRFTFESEIEYEGAELALEYPDYLTLKFNGEDVPVKVVGTYVDDAICRIPLPKIRKGENEILVTLRFGNVNSIESCYLLGNFGVEVRGYYPVITELPDVLYFKDIVDQKLAFYGGNVRYSFKINGGGQKTIEVGKYRGAVIKVLVDGEEKGYVDFPPHRLYLGELSEGEHTVDLILYGNRMNTFGQLHKTDEFLKWTGPDSWRTGDRFWTDEYMLVRTGILTAPRILTK